MKVYISATYTDLQAHREAVAAVLRRMGHQPIGMEEYVAEGIRPLQRCLTDVQACNAYVGIVAWRYGYVPRVADPPLATLPSGTQLGKTSITEFEFAQAVDSDKPILMFLLDPEAEWASAQFDAVSGDGDNGADVARLRQRVGERYLVSYFRSPDQLAGLVSAAIYRQEMSAQMELKKLNVEARLNDPPVRTNNVRDTTLDMITEVIAGPKEIDALEIDIGQGRDWWMTRLYFLSSLAADLTSIEVMIFVGEGRRFIGMVNPQIVKERLSQYQPDLNAYEQAVPAGAGRAVDMRTEVHNRAQLWERHMAGTGGEKANSVFVTRQNLNRWLDPYLIRRALAWDSSEGTPLQLQRLIDWPLRFVPVVEDEKFTRVVDKQAVAEQVARLFVREQVSRAFSTTR